MKRLEGKWRLRQTDSRTYHVTKAHFLPEGRAVSICNLLPYTLLGEVTSNEELYCRVCLVVLKKVKKKVREAEG